MRRKGKYRRGGIIFLGLIILFFSAVFLIIHSDVFTIKSVEVQIQKIGCVDENKIKDSSNIYGQSFFLINSAKIEYDLKKKFFCVKSVAISKIFPNKIKLSVFGREPAVILALLKDAEATESASSEKFVVDKEGVIYSTNIEQINVPFLFVSGLDLTLGQKIKESLIDNVLKILEKIKSFGVDVKDAKIYSDKMLLVNGTPKVIFRLDDKVETQIASLQLILKTAKIDDKTVEFVDLRFDKPVVKFAPKKK